MPERVWVGSVWRDMITGNGGSDTKCQPRRESRELDELKNTKNANDSE
jgi:hypothetical protein